MTLLHRKYTKGQFRAEKSVRGGWNVWCEQGALEALNAGDYRDRTVTSIHFVNNAYGTVRPGDPLWERMREVIAEGYSIATFGLGFLPDYVPWTGESDSMAEFDAIMITQNAISG